MRPRYSQSLTFILFILHNLYFLPSELILVNALKKCYCTYPLVLEGVYFQVLPLINLPIFVHPPPPPTHSPRLRDTLVFFFLHFCRNFVLGAASVHSILWTTCGLPGRIIQFVQKFWYLYRLIAIFYCNPSPSIQLFTIIAHVGQVTKTGKNYVKYDEIKDLIIMITLTFKIRF